MNEHDYNIEPYVNEVLRNISAIDNINSRLSSDLLRKIYNEVVNREPFLLSKIPKEFHTEEMCELAIKRDPSMAIYYFKREFQTEKFLMPIIKKNWRYLQYLNKDIQTERLGEEAILQSPYAINYVENQTDKLLWLAISKLRESGRNLKLEEPCSYSSFDYI